MLTCVHELDGPCLRAEPCIYVVSGNICDSVCNIGQAKLEHLCIARVVSGACSSPGLVGFWKPICRWDALFAGFIFGSRAGGRGGSSFSHSAQTVIIKPSKTGKWLRYKCQQTSSSWSAGSRGISVALSISDLGSGLVLLTQNN